MNLIRTIEYYLMLFSIRMMEKNLFYPTIVYKDKNDLQTRLLFHINLLHWKQLKWDG